MSHIPSAAMPHAKPHDPVPAVVPPRPAPKQESLPWGALAAGGVLAIGGAITAALLLRGKRAPARRKATGSSRKPATGKPRAKARKTKPAADSDN